MRSIRPRSLLAVSFLSAACASPHVRAPSPSAAAARPAGDFPTEPVCGSVPDGSFALRTKPDPHSLPILDVEVAPGGREVRFSGYDRSGTLLGGLDPNGNLAWVTRLDRSSANKPTGNWIEGGTIDGVGDELDGAELIHLGPRGEVGWRTSLPLGTVVVDTGSLGDGESIILAWRPPENRMDAYLGRASKTGEISWLHRLDRDDLTIHPTDMEPTDAGFLITGTAARFVKGSDGYDHLTNDYTIAVHIDRHGDIEWATAIELETGGGNQETHAVWMPGLDRIYVVAAGAPGVLVELDTRGQLISARTFGTSRGGRAILAASKWDANTLALSVEGPQGQAILGLYRGGAVLSSRQLTSDGSRRQFGPVRREDGRWVASAPDRMDKVQDVVVLSGTSSLDNGPCLESTVALLPKDVRAKVGALNLSVGEKVAPQPRTDLDDTGN